MGSHCWIDVVANVYKDDTLIDWENVNIITVLVHGSKLFQKLNKNDKGPGN